MKPIVSCFLSVLLLSEVSGASAQTSGAPPQGDPAERAWALETCESYAAYDQMYDCSCIADLFVEKRATMPDASTITVFNGLEESCPSASGAAERAYAMCAETFPFMGIDGDLEDHCSCASQEFGRRFVEEPGL